MPGLINLEDDANVFNTDMTVAEVRAMLDILDEAEVDPEVISELDKAQGDVHSGKMERAYFVITISP